MIKNVFIVFILRLLGYLGAMMSARVLLWTGTFIGVLLRILSPKRVRITLDNIQQAFPDKQYAECTSIMIGAYRNLGIVLIEVCSLYFLSDSQIKKMISFDNIELVHKHLETGNGLVLISAHYANWELMAYAAGLYSELSYLLVAKEQKNPFVSKALKNIRERAGNITVAMEHAAKPLLLSLKSNKPVALLIDQAADPKTDIFLPFFTRQAAVFEAPAALSLRYNAPLVFALPIRDPHGHYSVHLTEIPSHDIENTKKGIEQLTARHLAFLEQAIKDHPDQWAWQHNRWKYHG